MSDDTCVYTMIESRGLIFLHCSSLQDRSVGPQDQKDRVLFYLFEHTQYIAQGQGDIYFSSMIDEARWSSNMICLTEPPQAAFFARKYINFEQVVRGLKHQIATFFFFLHLSAIVI